MKPLFFVWLLLVGATLSATLVDLEWRLGGPMAIAAILVLAAFKIRLVGLDYMELRHAPLALRLAFEGWLAAITLIMFGMMTWGPSVFAIG